MHLSLYCKPHDSWINDSCQIFNTLNWVFYFPQVTTDRFQRIKCFEIFKLNKFFTKNYFRFSSIKLSTAAKIYGVNKYATRKTATKDLLKRRHSPVEMLNFFFLVINYKFQLKFCRKTFSLLIIDVVRLKLLVIHKFSNPGPETAHWMACSFWMGLCMMHADNRQLSERGHLPHICHDSNLIQQKGIPIFNSLNIIGIVLNLSIDQNG